MLSAVTYKGVLDVIFDDLSPHLEHKDKLSLRLTCRLLRDAVDTRDCRITGAWLRWRGKYRIPRHLPPPIPLLVPFDGARPILKSRDVELYVRHMRHLRALYISGMPPAPAHPAVLLNPSNLPHLEEVGLWPTSQQRDGDGGYPFDISSLFPENPEHPVPVLSIFCGMGALKYNNMRASRKVKPKPISIPVTVQRLVVRSMAHHKPEFVNFAYPALRFAPATRCKHVKIVLEPPMQSLTPAQVKRDEYKCDRYNWFIETLFQVYCHCGEDVRVEVIGLQNLFVPPLQPYEIPEWQGWVVEMLSLELEERLYSHPHLPLHPFPDALSAASLLRIFPDAVEDTAPSDDG
ncbi:hypothetical protein Q8F55_008654 [Vanrija albida]|uniref:F-box domain-containing protein n=1 Tax=Vanrija albida TaxID=181172 RepID=A0ABR3PRS0_9TREE